MNSVLDILQWLDGGQKDVITEIEAVQQEQEHVDVKLHSLSWLIIKILYFRKKDRPN